MFTVSGGLLVALFACGPAAGAVTPPGGGSVRSFAVDARIGASGGLHVQETIAYDLGSRHGHGFTQTLRRRERAGGRDRVYDYTNVTVTSPDAAVGGDLAYAVVFGTAEAHERRIETLSTWYRGADLARRA